MRQDEMRSGEQDAGDDQKRHRLHGQLLTEDGPIDRSTQRRLEAISPPPSATKITVSTSRVKSATKSVIPAKARSEEHTSELQSLMRISYAVFCLKKKTSLNKNETTSQTPPGQPVNTSRTTKTNKRHIHL